MKTHRNPRMQTTRIFDKSHEPTGDPRLRCDGLQTIVYEHLEFQLTGVLSKQNISIRAGDGMAVTRAS